MSNFMVGVISSALAASGKSSLAVAPPVAPNAAIARVGIGFLGLAQISSVYIEPIVGLFQCFFFLLLRCPSKVLARVLFIVLVGAALWWSDSITTASEVHRAAKRVEWSGLGTGFRALGDFSSLRKFIGVIIPAGIATGAVNLMNIHVASPRQRRFSMCRLQCSLGRFLVFSCLHLAAPSAEHFSQGLLPQKNGRPTGIFFSFRICFVHSLKVQDAMCRLQSSDCSFRLQIWAFRADTISTIGMNSISSNVAMARGALLNSMVTGSIYVFIVDHNSCRRRCGEWLQLSFKDFEQEAAQIKNWTQS